MPMVESPFEEVSPGFRPARAWRMSNDEEPAEHPPWPINWRLIGKISLLVISLLLLLLAIRYLTRPPTFYRVKTFVGSDIALFPARQGFLLREKENVFVLHDWKRGDECWRVFIDVPSFTPITYSLAPDGNYFAALTVILTQIHLLLWQNGKLISDTALAPMYRAHLKVMDDGRAFVWSSTPLTDALLLQKGKVIARGRLLDEHYSAISPDGSSMLAFTHNTGFEYGLITVKNRELALTKQNAVQDPCTLRQFEGYILDINLFNNGVLLANTGTVFDSAGQRGNTTGWQHESIAPGGVFAYEHRNTHARVFSPVTGDSWTFTVPEQQNVGDATMNGRYALVYYHRSPPKQLRMLFNALPVLAPLYKQEMLALYERPGRLRAELSLDIKTWWAKRSEPWEWWWYPSPDGHAIAFNIADRSTSKCLLFRW